MLTMEFFETNTLNPGYAWRNERGDMGCWEWCRREAQKIAWKTGEPVKLVRVYSDAGNPEGFRDVVIVE